MNILYVINTLHRGGAEAHLLLLAQGLRSQGAICEVAFLRSSVPGGSVDLRDAFEDAGIRTHYLRCEKSYDLRSGIRLNRILASRKWDVLHSHLPRADAAAAACKLFSPHQTWLSTIHHPYDEGNAYSGARLIPAMAPMWRMADGVIAVSEPVRQWCIDTLGVAPDGVHTIPHGIDLDQQGRCSPVQAPDANRHCIGAIGRYEERKGHETLIRAMVPILKEFPGAQLKIAGHDPWGYGDVLKRMIAELHLEEHVHLVGFMSDKDAFFSEIDVFAFASLAEGFGIVLLEAMEAGKPSVVSDIAPLTDIICPGTSGLSARREDPQSFADAILTLFRNPGYLRQMGEEAHRRVVQEFSKARMVEHTMEYYREVVLKTTGVAAIRDSRA